MSTAAIIGVLTDVFTSLVPTGSSPVPSLGQIYEDKLGNRYKFVLNSHSSALVVGDVVSYDYSGGLNTTVFDGATAALHAMAGVAMGAIPAAGYGWIQYHGVNSSINTEGTTDIALGDVLKAVDSQVYAVKDQSAGTESTYQSHIRALVAYTTNSAALKKGFISCSSLA